MKKKLTVFRRVEFCTRSDASCTRQGPDTPDLRRWWPLRGEQRRFDAAHASRAYFAISRPSPAVRTCQPHTQTHAACASDCTAVSSSLSQPISLTRAESQGRLGSPSYLRTARSHLPFGASFLADRCCSQSIMQFVASCARASDRSREPARVLRNLQTSTSTAARGRAALAPVACY
jgi:hypothetical protein